MLYRTKWQARYIVISYKVASCEGKEARNLHAANTLKAHSFVLAC